MAARAIGVFGAGHPLIAHLVRSGAVEMLGCFFGRGFSGVQRLNSTTTPSGLSQGSRGQQQGSSQ
jgi:hypothetical protein